MYHAPGVSYALTPPLPRPVRKVGAPLAAIIAMGTVAGLILILVTAVNPAGAVLGFTLSTVAMALVLLCYLWLDRWEPEPPRLLIMAFLWGASVAVLISVIFEEVVHTAIEGPGQDPGFTTMAVVAPVVEEAAKGLFLVLMLTGRRRNELNTLTDCLVYAGFTAVGFAWLENIFYIASGESLGASLATAVVRLVIGPFAHPLFTTMTGIGVYYALKKRSAAGKAGAILLGYLGAVVMHALWNGSAVLGSSTYLSVYVLWMMPVFALAIVLAIKSRRREGQIIAAKLPGMISAGLLTPVEASWVAALPARKAAVRSARQFGGRAAASSVKRFIIQVVELGYVRDRIDRGFGDERVFALQNEEVQGVVAARAAAGPALARLAGYGFPVH
ncbi:MAG: PrsW family intramembrane metalloprotease [Mycobacterium sp.]